MVEVLFKFKAIEKVRGKLEKSNTACRNGPQQTCTETNKSR